MAYITIDKANFFYNLSQLALKAGSKERLSVVLKDNAYGHGLGVMAALASEFGIPEAVVISNREAETIRDFFDHILILDDRAQKDEKYSYAVTEMRELERVDPEIAIELKVDTGMRRNGIMLKELGDALSIIRRRGLKLYGVMTHFRNADRLGSDYYWQKKRFENVKTEVTKAGFRSVRFHSCNSAALLRSGSFSEDMARVGIAIYGYNELPEVFGKIELRPVLKLWAQRVSTRVLKKGERIGYGGEFAAPRTMTVSAYDIGYGHGWPRGDSSNPYTLPSGRQILGRVSMDFVSVEGDEENICIMDNAQYAAGHFGTISYEMTTALMPDIERRVV